MGRHSVKASTPQVPLTVSLHGVAPQEGDVVWIDSDPERLPYYFRVSGSEEAGHDRLRLTGWDDPGGATIREIVVRRSMLTIFRRGEGR
jgi:hypothetical protein